MLVAHTYKDRPRLPDIEDVKARVNVVELIGRDVKLTRRSGDYWGLCPFHQERTPSFKVDRSARFFKCFGCGAKGDAIDYLCQSRGMDTLDALRSLAIEAGLIPDDDGNQRPPMKFLPPVEADRGEEEAIRAAQEIWAACAPAVNTSAETYLRWRGILLGIPPTLRFHPSLEHTTTGLFFPALVACVQVPDGEVTGVVRTYLLPGGEGKARVSQPRLSKGPRRNGAVRLAPVPGDEMGIAEGIETALSAMQLFRVPTWAACGATLDKVAVPDRVKTVHIFADNGGAGLRTARAAVEAFTGQRRKVILHTPPKKYGDWNDVLLAEVKK